MPETFSNDWLDRYPLRTDVDRKKWLDAIKSDDFIDDVLRGPIAYQQRFINHFIRVAGAAAFPFLKKLFEKTADRRLKLFIIARVSVCFVRVNGKVDRNVYKWLADAMDEIYAADLEYLIGGIRARFSDLAFVLHPSKIAKLRAAS